MKCPDDYRTYKPEAEATCIKQMHACNMYAEDKFVVET